MNSMKVVSTGLFSLSTVQGLSLNGTKSFAVSKKAPQLRVAYGHVPLRGVTVSLEELFAIKERIENVLQKMSSAGRKLCRPLAIDVYKGQFGKNRFEKFAGPDATMLAAVSTSLTDEDIESLFS